jgi:hypothetical protein
LKREKSRRKRRKTHDVVLEVVLESEVDHSISLFRSSGETIKVVKRSDVRYNTFSRFELRRLVLVAGEGEDGVTMGD